MEAFREFNGLRGLVIDSKPSAGKYRVAKVGGGIDYVTEGEYNNSVTADVLKVEEAKLEVMEEMYVEWVKASEEGNEELMAQVEEGIKERWEKIFISDEIVGREEFKLLINREINIGTYGKMMLSGYGFDRQDGRVSSRVLMYKEFHMDEEFKRCSKLLKLAGVGDSDIAKNREFISLFEEFKQKYADKVFELSLKFYVQGVTVYSRFEPDLLGGVVNHVYGVAVDGEPLTRELAIEIAENMVAEIDNRQ